MNDIAKRRSLPALIFFFLAGTFIMGGLGFWQIQRLHWKNTITENMKAAPNQVPVPIENVNQEDFTKYLFKRVHVKGHWGKGPNFFVTGRTHNKRPGYHLMNVITLEDGRYLLVNLGWVGHKNISQRGVFPADFVGRIREASRMSWLMPSHKPEIQEWTFIDLKEIGQSLGIELLPFYVDHVRSDVGRAPFPIPNQLNLTNMHLGYAITWFGLTTVWVIVFLLLIIRTMREQKELERISYKYEDSESPF